MATIARWCFVVPAFAVALTLVGCGGSEPVQKSIPQQLNEAKAIANPSSRCAELIRVAELQRQAGNTMDASSTLAMAADAAGKIDHAYTQATTLSKVAAAQSAVTSKSTARKTLRRAAQAIDKIEDNHTRLLASLEQSEAALQMKETGQCLSMLAAAEELAEKVEVPDASCECLINIANGYSQAEKGDEAARVANAVLEKIKTLDNARRRADLLGDVALALRKAGSDEDHWRPVLDESRRVTDGIEDPLARSYAFVHLAQCRREVGQADVAKELLAKAAADADKVTDTGMRGPLIEAIRQAGGQAN